MSLLSRDKTRRNRLRPKRPNRLKKAPKVKRDTGPVISGALLRNVFVTILSLAGLVVLCVGLLFGYRWLTTRSYFNLKEVNITGNQRLAYGDLLALADVELGRNCLDLNVAKVEQRLKANPWIEMAAVKRELPNRLRIFIRERQPSFWVRSGEAMFYADLDGRPIAKVEPGGFASLPVLEIDMEVRDRTPVLKELVSMMDNQNLPFALGQTAWIRLTAIGEMEIFLDSLGLTLSVELDDWKRQMKRLELVWQDLRARGEFNKARSLTARSDRVLAALK